MLHAAFLAQLLIHFRGEKSDRAPPLGLCPIKCGIRIAEQCRRGRTILGIDRYTDADADSDSMAFDLQILRHGRKNALGYRGSRRLLLIVLREDCELISSQTVDEWTLH